MRSISGQAVTSTSLDITNPSGDVDNGDGDTGDTGDVGDIGDVGDVGDTGDGDGRRRSPRGGGVKVGYCPFPGGLMAIVMPGEGISDHLVEAVAGELAAQMTFLHGE